jgi:PPOX class probable FMN-dependent enzyme
MATTPPFDHVVTSLEEVRAVSGEPSERSLRKQLSALDRHCRTFIGLSPFLLLATSGADGSCDVSPRGDAPGFALVLDDHTLVIPDRPGNRRRDSLGNIFENPRVSMIFLIPGVEETLRVGGDAAIVRDPDLLERLTARGRVPQFAIVVRVREAFLHCPKAFKRSRLWDTATWPERSALPTLAEMIKDHARLEVTAEELQREYDRSYETQLY